MNASELVSSVTVARTAATPVASAAVLPPRAYLVLAAIVVVLVAVVVLLLLMLDERLEAGEDAYDSGLALFVGGAVVVPFATPNLRPRRAGAPLSDAPPMPSATPAELPDAA